MTFTQAPQPPQVGNVQPTPTPQERAQSFARQRAMNQSGTRGGIYATDLPPGTTIQAQILGVGTHQINGKARSFAAFNREDGYSDPAFVAIPKRGVKSPKSMSDYNEALACGFVDPSTGIEQVAFVLPQSLTETQMAKIVPNGLVTLTVGEPAEGRTLSLFNLVV